MAKRGRKSAAELAATPIWERVRARDRPPPPRVLPDPPDHLSAATKAWWEEVVAAFEFKPHEYRGLQACAEAWDRMVAARETIAKEGMSFIDAKGMIRTHPAVAIERDSRTAYFRALRELRLGEVEPPKRHNGGLGVSYEQIQAWNNARED